MNRYRLHSAAACALLLVACLHRCKALDNGLSRKPPLGYNTWNYFGCDINETVVRTAADRLVSLGLAEAGYTYVNIDDCWQSHERSAGGQLQADPSKFPSGMAALAEYVHGKGLQFGIYSDAGTFTCGDYPGSRNHEVDDANTFAAWGVDYLKYDNCWADDADMVQRYTDMRDALNKTGRPIYYSMCNWGRGRSWQWAAGVGNSWRTYEDIFPNWPSMLRALDNGAAGLGQYAGPGGWNDPDMLEVGVAQWSLAQQRSHFALWALVKAPLLIGANLAAIPQESLEVLKAKELIAINQDELGVAGDIIWKDCSTEVWAAPLSGNQRAVVLFNRHKTWLPKTIRVTWTQLGYTSPGPLGPGVKALVRDLYAGRDLGVFEGGFEAPVASYDALAIKVTPVGQVDGASANWRPWSDPAAAALQARMRAASQRHRRWIELRDKLIAFVLAHRYTLALAAAVLIGAMIVALVKLWLRLRRVYLPARRRGTYKPVPQQELGSKEGQESSKLSVVSELTYQSWERLPSRSATPEGCDVSTDKPLESV